MELIQPEKTYDLLNKPWDEIQKLVDGIVIKILEHNGLTSDYVKAHPDEFSIIHDPGHGLCDVTDTFVVMHKGTILGRYMIHSCYDDSNMSATIRIGYTLGGDS